MVGVFFFGERFYYYVFISVMFSYEKKSKEKLLIIDYSGKVY